MACKLAWPCQAALLAVVWMPIEAVSGQFEEATPAGSGVEPEPIGSVEVDIAFIEFLGKWETDDGEWLAPSDLADETFEQLIETVEPLETEKID